jgi:molecular chaperone GrpE (heat shock protein)
MATEAYLEFPVGPASAKGVAAAGSGDDITEFIEKILPIIDNLEYASKFAQDEDNPYTKGIIQTYENAVKILEENGITIISGEGEPFDFNYQNAVAHVTDVDLPENTVKQVMQTGYVYKGKVIRTASVIVAN